MCVHIERNKPESYTLRLLPEGKKYGDKYILSLTIDCSDTECEVKALDHKLTKAQRLEIIGPIREKAGSRSVFSIRHGRRIEY